MPFYIFMFLVNNLWYGYCLSFMTTERKIEKNNNKTQMEAFYCPGQDLKQRSIEHFLLFQFENE